MQFVLISGMIGMLTGVPENTINEAVMWTNYLGVLAGLVMLAYGADRFVDGAAGMAQFFGMSTLLVGVIIVGMATSAPEILVGSVAALDGKTEIAIGNAIGSNIANIGLVLGFTVLLFPTTVSSDTLKYEYAVMWATIVLALALLFDRDLSRLDSVIMIVGFVLSLYVIICLSKRSAAADPLVSELVTRVPEPANVGATVVAFIVGLMLLLVGARLLVACSVNIAKYYGLSDLVIGLTIIAVGTSLPELATSITAFKKREAELAIGNVIGSNIFNILAVIGVSGLIHATTFDQWVLIRDFPVMIALGLLVGWMVFIHGEDKFDRVEGGGLFLCFIAYQWLLFRA